MKKKTLVLGASANPARYACMAIKSLVSRGIEVVGVGLKEEEVAGVKITNQREMFDDVHTVTLYLNPQRQKDYYDYILSLMPERVIFNPGTENPELYRLLRERGIEVVVGCTLVMLSMQSY